MMENQKVQDALKTLVGEELKVSIDVRERTIEFLKTTSRP